VAVDVVRVLLPVGMVVTVPMLVIMAMVVPVVMMAVPMIVTAFVGFRLQPFLHVGGLALGIVETGVQDGVGVDLPSGDGMEWRAGIEMGQTVLQLLELGSLAMSTLVSRRRSATAACFTASS